MDVLQVGADGGLAPVEQPGGLAVGDALGDELEDFPLAVRQRLEGACTNSEDVGAEVIAPSVADGVPTHALQTFARAR